MLKNDDLVLTPRTTFTGRALNYDFPAVRIGIAEYDEGPTGCTIFHFPEPVKMVADIRGGASQGVFATYPVVDGIVFAGGSLMGLSALSGAAAGILAYQADPLEAGLPAVAGAILYDYVGRDNLIYPDVAAGRAAFESAQTGIFPMGACGAGRSASVGGTYHDDWRESSGQGAAFGQTGPVKMLVCTVVNAAGAVHDRSGQVVRGNWNTAEQRRYPAREHLDLLLEQKAQAPSQRGHTTLTLLVTNLKLERYQLQQVARQVHSSMARAIQPFQTLDDGDAFFAVTTDEVEYIGANSLGLLAGELAWDAILEAVKG